MRRIRDESVRPVEGVNNTPVEIYNDGFDCQVEKKWLDKING